MGIYKTTYLGPYIEIPIQTKLVDNWIKVNAKTGQKFDFNLNFDPVTGDRLEGKNQPKKQQQNFSFYDVDIAQFGFPEDAFFQPAETQNNLKICTWLTNDEDFHFIVDYPENLDLTPYKLNFGELLTEFETKYHQCLKLIIQNGFEYELKIGIVNYGH
jgi:hypothetical protein